MKKTIRTVLAVAVSFAAVITGCKKDELKDIAPEITSVSPESGYVNDQITITGKNFGADAESNTVKFGSVKAAVVSAAADKLVVTAPDNNPGAVKITVTTSDGTSGAVDFTYLVPQLKITELVPDTGGAGDEIIIRGENFNTNPDNNTVLFGTAMAEVLTASDAELKVVVPEGLGKVNVTVAVGENKSSSLVFNYIINKTIITGVTPSAAEVGEEVVISGTFMAPFEDNEVYFGDVKAEVKNITETSITVKVPAVSGDVNIVVKSKKDQSEPVAFSVVAGDPVISSLSVAKGEVGDVITIKGSNFSSNPADISVMFGNVEQKTDVASTTEIKVIVPQYETGAIDVKVSVKVGTKTSNQVDWHYYTYWYAERIAGTGVDGSHTGKGNALEAQLHQPVSVISDFKGSLYIGESTGGLISRLNPDGTLEYLTGKYKTTGAADGKGEEATFKYVYSLAVDKSGNVYIADVTNHLIRKMTPDGTVSTIAGQLNSAWEDTKDGIGTEATFAQPYVVAMYDDNNLLIGDASALRIMNLTTLEVKTIVGSLTSRDAAKIDNFYSIKGIAVSADKKTIYVCDGLNNCIKSISYPDGTVTLYAGPTDRNNILANTTTTIEPCAALDALFYNPTNIAIDSKGNIFVSDGTGNYNHRIRKISTSGIVTTVAGTGAVGDGSFINGPAMDLAFKSWGLGIDENDNLYIGSQINSAVYRLTLK